MSGSGGSRFPRGDGIGLALGREVVAAKPKSVAGRIYDRLPLKQPVLSMFRGVGLPHLMYKHLHFTGGFESLVGDLVYLYFDLDEVGPPRLANHISDLCGLHRWKAGTPLNDQRGSATPKGLNTPKARLGTRPKK